MPVAPDDPVPEAPPSVVQLRPDPGPVVRMTIGPQVVAVVLLGIAAGMAAFGVATAARRALGWALAAGVVAALLEPVVRVLSRHVPRVVAILTGLLMVGVLVVGVAGGVLADLGNQFDRLRDEAPRAARQLEDSDRFGEQARKFRLAERVNEVLDQLRDPTSGLASERAASAASAYVVGAVLTAFLLSSGPTLGKAALQQIGDPVRRQRVGEIVAIGFTNGRTYVLFGIAQAVVVGFIAWALCYWEDVTAPIVVGVAVAALSVVPGFGILVGGLFGILLEAGLGTGDGVVRLIVAFVLLQIANTLFTRRVVVPRSLAVGPAVIVISVIVGFEIYGIGGAIYAAILAIFGAALLEAAGLNGAGRTIAAAANAARAPAATAAQLDTVIDAAPELDDGDTDTDSQTETETPPAST
jgi:predicted PurR-regulated permease PerM